MSSACALASAVAIAPIDSLDRCMGALRPALRGDEIKADCSGFRAPRADAVPGRFLRIVRHQPFQFRLRILMFEIGLPGPPEHTGKFRPGVRGAHIQDPYGRDPRPWGLDAEEAWGLAALDAAPKFPLGRQQQVLVERISMDRDFHPLAAAGDDGEHRVPGGDDPHVMLQLRHILSAAASSENAHGSMNLASNPAPVGSTTPSSVAAIHRITGCKTRRCLSLITCPVFPSYQRRLSSSVATPSWTMRLPDR